MFRKANKCQESGDRGSLENQHHLRPFHCRWLFPPGHCEVPFLAAVEFTDAGPCGQEAHSESDQPRSPASDFTCPAEVSAASVLSALAAELTDTADDGGYNLLRSKTVPAVYVLVPGDRAITTRITGRSREDVEVAVTVQIANHHRPGTTLSDSSKLQKVIR